MDSEEDQEDYVRGGYHPVNIGAVFSGGRYVVVRKLGWGHFATVWLANDQRTDRHVALKVVKSARRYTEAALDEIEFLRHLTLSPAPEVSTHPGRSHITSFLDHFRHVGPNGTHICMVFEVLGENLLSLIRRHHGRGVPVGVVRQIAKQVLLGLDYVHRCCGIIHADIKPENILTVINDVESIIHAELIPSSMAGESNGIGAGNDQKITVKIADFGSAMWTDHRLTGDIQTRQYRCPEVILGARWGTSADIWSVACVIFELITGGDYLFEPTSGPRYSKDEDHIAQMMELMGNMPREIALSGKYSSEIFNRKGQLRNVNKLRYWGLEAVLHEKYSFPISEAEALASFLTLMLRLDPDERAPAGELMRHPWLNGVVMSNTAPGFAGWG